ncbi:unnamed protein product, partial [Symbiodinium sp. CCMP2456]
LKKLARLYQLPSNLRKAELVKRLCVQDGLVLRPDAEGAVDLANIPIVRAKGRKRKSATRDEAPPANARKQRGKGVSWLMETLGQ